MANQRDMKGLYQKQPAKGSVCVHFRLDPETNRQMLDAVNFLFDHEMPYSQSVIVRAALRDLVKYMKRDGADLGEIERKLEAARGVRG